MLRLVVRIVVVLLALLVAIGATELVASESGEVVVLRTVDEAGGTKETRLWIVDDGSHVVGLLGDGAHQSDARPGAITADGSHAWLRAGHEGAGWYVHLLARPDVEFVRGGEAQPARANPEVGARERVNGLMRQKYGWADAYIGMLFGRDDAIPIRLDPREG